MEKLTQRDIDKIQTEFRILSILIFYSEGLSLKCIVQQLGMDGEISAVENLISKMKSDGLIFRVGDLLCISCDGRIKFAEEQERPTFDLTSCYFKFRDEVLEGITESGYPTKKENAALDKPHRNFARHTDDKMIDVVVSSKFIETIASKNEITIDEAIELILSGALKKCESCGKWKIHTRDNGAFKKNCNSCRRRDFNLPKQHMS